MALVFLYPAADFSVGGAITSTSGSPHFRSVDEAFNATDDADQVFSADTTNGGAGVIVYTLTALPPVQRINFVTLVSRNVRELGAGGTDTLVQSGLHIGGTRYNDVAFLPPTTYAERRKQYLQNPATVADWLPTDFAGGGIRIAWEGWDPAATFRFPAHSQIYLEIDCVLAPQALGFVRDRLSRESRLVSRPSDVIELGPPLEVLGGLEPLTDLALSHVGLPPAGVGVKRHQRRVVTILASKLDLDELRHEVDVYDPRRFRVADFDTCYSPEDEPSPLAQGVARLSQGGRTFTRTSKAWVPSPLDGRILELGLEDEQLSRDGLLLLNQRLNYCPYSSFVGALAGTWTLVGTGSNGSAIAADPNVIYFDPSVVPGGAVKVTSGTPLHAADLYAQSTASATVPANTTGCLWIPHLDVGGQLAWLLQRAIDSFYWNDTTGAWQSFLFWNTLPLRSSVFTPDRSKAIAFGGSGTTVTMPFGRPVSGGVAGQVNWVGHVQIEDGPYPTPPIVTVSTTPVTRNRDQLTLTNNHGQRTWPLQAFSVRLRVKPLWSDSEITGLTRSFLDLSIDNGHNQRILYTQGTGWIAQRRLAGTSYQAIRSGGVTAGQEQRIAMRATGPEGELGLAPYTIDIWVNGVKGTTVVAPDYFRGAPSLMTMRVGHQASPTTLGADCAYLWREILPWVLPDDELVDF